MIRINLLPEDYRRAERTSPKVFATVLASVIAVCCSLGWFGYVYFGELGRLEVQHQSVAEKLTSLNEQVVYFDRLSKEKADFAQREKTIRGISKSRVLYTKVLDQLIDTVNNDGDTERHMGWFRSMTVKDGRSNKEGPSVAMPGWVQGADVKRLGDFHDDLEATPFFRNVTTKSPPAGTVQTDEDKTPPDALFFALKWTFAPPADWVDTDKPTAPGK